MNTLASALLGIQPDEQKKLAVWAKGRPIPNFDSAVWRHDYFGSVMRYADHGNRSSDYGWEFDHFPVPASAGGRDIIANLRPLHWRANASLGGLLGNR
jgi:hypothetical protein